MNPGKRHNPNRQSGGEKSSSDHLARVVEYSVAIFLTAATLTMHIRYFLYAGGLWRDEVTSVNLAGSNPLSQAIANLHNDSFPILWLLVVRFWERSGFGASDRGMRALGLLAGLSILAVLWRNARRFGRTAPVVSIALIGFTSAVVCYGDSIRGYGLGIFLGLLATGLVWEMTRRETFGTFLGALIAALLSVHVLYFNCVLLLAACCGAFAVTLRAKRWKSFWLVLILGLISAGSMLIYVPVIRQRRDFDIFQIPLSFGSIVYYAQRSVEFVADGNVAPGFHAFWWTLAVAAAVYLAPVKLFVGRLQGLSRERRDAVIFCTVYLFVGLLAYGAFLKFLSYLPQPWYFLAAMAMVAGSLEGLFAGVTSPKMRVLVAAFAAAFAINAALPVWENAGVRRTNVDLIAARVQHEAVKGDVIVMAPWSVGGPFLRYYHGPAKVTAIPPLPFLAYQQYGLLLRFLSDRNAIDPVIRDVSEALHDGHRVWIVGEHGFPRSPPVASDFPHLPDLVFWRDQVFYAVRHNSKEIRLLKIPSDQPISAYETESLSVAEGWDDHSTAETKTK